MQEKKFCEESHGLQKVFEYLYFLGGNVYVFLYIRHEKTRRYYMDVYFSDEISEYRYLKIFAVCSHIDQGIVRMNT